MNFERIEFGNAPKHNLQVVGVEDTVHMLLYREKVVAVVTERRNGSNLVQFSFLDMLREIEKKSK